ncbi:hypothetical protein B0H16DRAFT_1452525 [Mycena metata]|uniref:Uncharacterized protein n=1 Tax=Mycena metata TaxID=1033252 RepID=A0AAD7JPY6_9AGAR|nr:hypothetical protein B0H16DRAFT_1452525 [Mycena metata]
MPQLLLCSLCSLAFSRYLSSILKIVFVPLWILRLAHTRNEQQGRHEDGRVNGGQRGSQWQQQQIGYPTCPSVFALHGDVASLDPQTRNRAFVESQAARCGGELSWTGVREELEQAVPPCPPFE